MDTQEAQYLTQAQLDKAMVDKGLDRSQASYQTARRKKRVSYSEAGRHLMRWAMEQFSEGVKVWLRQAKKKKAAVHKAALEVVEEIGYETCCLITTRMVLDAIGEAAHFSYTAREVGRAIEEEWVAKQLKKQIPMDFAKAFGVGAKGTSKEFLRNGVKELYKHDGIKLKRIPVEIRAQLGALLLARFIETTGLVEEYDSTKGQPKNARSKSATKFLIPTQTCLTWLESATHEYGAAYPYYLPTIAPPQPWAGPFEGGFPESTDHSLPLIISSRRQEGITLWERSQNREYVDSVNYLQSVKWRISSRVLEVFDHFSRRPVEIGSMVGPPKDLPERPLESSDPAVIKEWKYKSYRVYRDNANQKISRLNVLRLRNLAAGFSATEFHHVYQCDFRGRMYPRATLLSPQSHDLARSLMEFAKPVSMRAPGAEDALRIGVANTAGHDKTSFAERIAWTAAQDDLWRAIYKDPISNTQWISADKPWQHLSLAMELGRLLTEGPGIESGVVIHQDGTCNGLQSYALLLRDEDSARAVNVLPSDVPQDVYQVVADELTRLLMQSSDPVDAAWLAWFGGAVPRSITKRPVMTLPYGVTTNGMCAFVRDWYHESLVSRGVQDGPFGATAYQASYKLVVHLREALRTHVASAVRGMAWLRQCANVANRHQVAMAWETPSGFPVQHRYNSYNYRILKTYLFGRCYRQRSNTWKDPKLLLRKQLQAIAPNFIHSLDAAALSRTIRHTRDAGIHNFVAIHDSYGTDPASYLKVSKALRRGWVETFSNDLLGELKTRLQRDLPPNTPLPELPDRGQLDIRCLYDSKYFFN